MFKSSRARRSLFASLIVAGSLGMGAGLADAAVVKEGHYQLTKQEKKAACGNFQGTIIFGDGSGSIDCQNGVATFPIES
jgi:hypothetical protein